MHVLAYGREVSAEERQKHLAFLVKVEQSVTVTEPDADKRRRQAWSVLCHVILAANEFVYVR